MQKKWWEKEKFNRKLGFLKDRSKVIKTIRNFFDNENFQEVETPILQISPGMEPHIFTFATDYVNPFGEKETTYHLHTSPEFTMKKLLVAGMPKIYQITKVFRNRENSETHSPEFSMLEWYRANDTYESIMKDCENLIRECFLATGKKIATFRGISCNPFADFEYLTVCDAFKNATGYDLLETIDDHTSHDPNPDKIKQVALSLNDASCNPSDADRWEDVFFRIYLNKIEPFLGKDRPTIIYDYPLCLAALSRPKPNDKRLCERFEVYICGLELANAFGELTNPDIQEARFKADMELKQKLYNEQVPIDKDFIDALKYGMPESSGIALGVDRLAMLCSDAQKIEDVLWAQV